MSMLPPAPRDDDSLEILARIRDGDSTGWDLLYHRYHDELLFYVRHRLGHQLRAHLQSEDIFQSVAVEALRSLREFEYRGEGSLLRFLQRMVQNKIRDRADTVRARKRRAVGSLEDVPHVEPIAPGSAVRYHAAEHFDRLERALGGLPADMREVILLRRIEGLDGKETARRLQRSDAATRKLYSRALARLSALFHEAPPS